VERNPYEASSARLLEVSEARPAVRPRAVTIAVSLLAANLVIGFWRDGFRFPTTSADDPALFVTVMPFVAPAVLVWLYCMIFIGRNWARLTLLV
jgi:hypothetical protein